MATPKEVFESPVYRKLVQEPQDIPWACFKTVYEALGDALQMLDEQSEKDFIRIMSDSEIGKVVEEIAYKQHCEEQSDDFLAKFWILRSFLKERFSHVQ